MERLVGSLYDHEKWKCDDHSKWKCKNQNLRCHQLLHCPGFTKKYFKCLWKCKTVLKISASQKKSTQNYFKIMVFVSERLDYG